MSNGEPLVSAGEFSMFPTQNGMDLIMADSYSVVLPFASNVSGMSVYAGSENSPGIALGRVNWLLITDTTKNRVAVRDNTVKITTTNTKFVNGDRSARPVFDTVINAAPVGGNQSFTISLTSTEGLGDDQDIKAFVFYDGLRCLWPMTNIKFGLITENNVPKMKAHFVVFAVHLGYTYAGIMAATPEDGFGYKLNLVKTSIEDFRKQVNALQ